MNDFDLEANRGFFLGSDQPILLNAFLNFSLFMDVISVCE